MVYFDEMLTKYGFNSGAIVPDGAKAYRTVYITLLNKLLGKLGSNIRVVAWDGYKNPYLIVKVPKEVFDKLTGDPSESCDEVWSLLKEAGLENEPEFDEAGHNAVEEAIDIYIDDIVEVKVTLPDNLNEVIDQCIKETGN